MAEALRVLYVDDDPEDILLVQDLFERAGDDAFSLSPATSAKAAEALAAVSSFDVLLLDYRLGASTGTEVLEDLRARGIRAPAIFLTGQSDQSVVTEAMKAGAVDFVPKSELTADRLLPLIRAAAGSHRQEETESLNLRRARMEGALALQVAGGAPVGLIALDLRDNVLFHNQVAEQLLGDVDVDKIPPEVLEETGQRWWSGIRAGGPGGVLCDIGCNVIGDLKVVAIMGAGSRLESEAIVADFQRRLVQRRGELAEVASVLAHDLRNHLRRIRHKSMIDDPVRRAEALDQMDIMMGELVTYARLSLNPHELHNVNLNEMLSSALGILETTIPGIRQRVESDDLPSVAGDPLQLRQVFLNLIQNADRHGGPDTKIRLEARPDGSIRVSDDGPGIDPAMRDTVFHPFRVMTSEGVGKSTGIGLAYCRRVLTLHGGSMDLDDEGRIVVRFGAGTGAT